MSTDRTAAPGQTVDEILSAATDETRAALRTLGELVGNQPTAVLSIYMYFKLYKFGILMLGSIS